MGFVLDWQKKLGYRSDPFVPEPRKRVHDFFVARKRERELINLFIIKQDRFGIISGSSSIGKTTLLRWIEEELEHKVNVLFLKGSILSNKKLFLETLIKKSLNPIEWLIKRDEKLSRDEKEPFLLQKLKKRQLIILVDDARNLSSDNIVLLQRILNSSSRVQIIFTLERVLKMHEEFAHDSIHLSLKPLSEKERSELLKKRLELVGTVDSFPFDSQEMKRLVATENITILLKEARDKAIELSLKVKGPPPKQISNRSSTKLSQSGKESEDVVKRSKLESNSESESESESKKEPLSRGGPAPKPHTRKKSAWHIRFVSNEELKTLKEKKNREERKKMKEMLQNDLSNNVLKEEEELGRILHERGADDKSYQSKKKFEVTQDDNVKEVIQSLVDEMASDDEPTKIIKGKRR